MRGGAGLTGQAKVATDLLGKVTMLTTQLS